MILSRSLTKIESTFIMLKKRTLSAIFYCRFGPFFRFPLHFQINWSVLISFQDRMIGGPPQLIRHFWRTKQNEEIYGFLQLRLKLRPNFMPKSLYSVTVWQVKICWRNYNYYCRQFHQRFTRAFFIRKVRFWQQNFVCWWNWHLGSISSTFFVQLLRM